MSEDGNFKDFKLAHEPDSILHLAGEGAHLHFTFTFKVS